MAGELQVGQALARFGGERQGLGVALGEPGTQGVERGAPLLRDLIRDTVAVEELCLVVGVARQQPRQPFGQTRMAGERAVLGAREVEAALERGQAQRERGSREGVFEDGHER
ncbi:hypothetical protein D9M69_684000 [compost metagenome]